MNWNCGRVRDILSGIINENRHNNQDERQEHGGLKLDAQISPRENCDGEYFGAVGVFFENDVQITQEKGSCEAAAGPHKDERDTARIKTPEEHVQRADRTGLCHGDP